MTDDTDFTYMPSVSSSIMAGHFVGGEKGGGVPLSSSVKSSNARSSTVCIIFVAAMIIHFIALVGALVFADDLGTWGRTYPIAEENLINVLKKRAGRITTSQLTFNQAFDAYLDNKFEEKQFSVWLPDATEPQVRTVDLTQYLSKDIVDHSGRVIAKKGTAINPLSKVSLITPLLFIDGNDDDHIAWAMHEIKQAPKSLVILIHGNPLKLGKQWERDVYFDQGGKLSRRFELSVVPSKVTQDGSMIKVEEFAL